MSFVDQTCTDVTYQPTFNNTELEDTDVAAACFMSYSVNKLYLDDCRYPPQETTEPTASPTCLCYTDLPFEDNCPLRLDNISSRGWLRERRFGENIRLHLECLIHISKTVVTTYQTARWYNRRRYSTHRHCFPRNLYTTKTHI